MRQRDLDGLRSGWDLVLDIDCKNWELTKLITSLLVKIIRSFGISSVTVKFSGNKGFHIGVPSEAFPKKIHGKDIHTLFPEGPRRIAFYLIHILEENQELVKTLSEKSVDIAKSLNINPDELLVKVCMNCGTKQPLSEKKCEFICPFCEHRVLTSENLRYMNCEKCSKMMVKHDYTAGLCLNCGKREFKERLDAARIIELDTLLISSRHLYRAPYSLHEKSGLVSVPIDINNILTFDKKEAQPENLVIKHPFLSHDARADETARLFLQAFDFTIPQKEKENKRNAAIEVPATAIPEQHFPPCIQRIAQGMEDGRKRALFILINFLRSVGWSYEQVEQYVKAWNERNPQQLRENYVVGQLSYAKRKKPVLPPNCDNIAYYQSLGIKCADTICTRCKNPVNYAKRSVRMQTPEKKKKTKKDEMIANAEEHEKRPER